MPRTRKSRKPGVSAIEPGSLTVPTMDRPSIAFAWFLDNMQIGRADDNTLVLYCGLCLDLLCEIEETDTLRVLFNTALSHDCASHP